MSRILDKLDFAPVADGGGFEVAEVDCGGEVFYALRNEREGVGVKAARPGVGGISLTEFGNAFHVDGWSYFTWGAWDEEWGALCEADALRDAMKWGER